LSSRPRLRCENILRREENFFRQGALQASASLRSHNSIRTLRPRTEYEARRSNAQSTIIFSATGFACRMFAAFAVPQGTDDGVEV
jgi:hypothetical protein